MMSYFEDTSNETIMKHLPRMKSSGEVQRISTVNVVISQRSDLRIGLIIRFGLEVELPG